MTRALIVAITAAALGSAVAAQGADDAGWIAWRVGVEERAEGRVAIGGIGLREGELGLARRLAVEPAPVSRETLEGRAEALQPYEALPGGIVLGLEARVSGIDARGARIGRGADGGIELVLGDGRRLAAPRIEERRLAACLAFVAGRDDSVVDLVVGPGGSPRVAEAFAGSGLERELVELDRMPHRRLPETQGWKSLIVDREVRVGERDGALALDADLEVRFYLDERGWAERMRTVGVAGADLIGPRVEHDLADELAPVAEIAGWCGFLRWAERVDPAGVAALRRAAAGS